METTVRENIDWVGHVDWTVRDFHSYTTARGATYNAYLVRDEKTALIDTVKEPFADGLLAGIRHFIDPAKIDYLVCNHAEPDHAGAFAAIVAACPRAKVVCNDKCRKTLSLYFDTSKWDFEIVKTGSSLSLGKRQLTFVDTPFVHWPESMVTYVPEERLLFSMDAFGQHFAFSNLFDDQNPIEDVMAEAKRYYANIVMPFGKKVASALEACAALDIDLIAPAHGVVWRSHCARILAEYNDWAVCKPKAKVLVIYDSMWDSTARMARAIQAGATKNGVDAKLISIRASDLTEIATEVLDAACIAFGSSTLNRGPMPMVAAVLSYLQGLSPSGKIGLPFGSYGWGISGAQAIQKYMEEMKWELLREPIKSQYRPSEEILGACREAGAALADRALEATR